jgi:hypothetical protein
MATPQVIIADIDAAVGLISSVNPILFAAYAAMKMIWTSTNPGKTESDFITFLLSTSQTDASSDAAWLVSKGYRQGTDGGWLKPT